MAMNKKAIVFTVISLVLLLLLFFSMNIDKTYSLRDKSFVIGERINTANHFINDVEKDIERGNFIATFRALLGIQQYITGEGKFLNDTQATFMEVLVNGTIDGVYLSVMNETELNVWISRIQYEANKIAIVLDYRINDARLYHTNPWTVTCDLNVTLNISDARGTASWSRDQLISSTVNITTFEDPMYSVYTYGRVINTVEKSNITDFTDGDDTTNLLAHLDNSLYIESASGPSYIMRLSGSFSNSTYGIESLVNLKKLEDMLLPIEDKSSVDYMYFSPVDPPSWLINNTYNWFRLDNESDHLAIYEVQNLTI